MKRVLAIFSRGATDDRATRGLVGAAWRLAQSLEGSFEAVSLGQPTAALMGLLAPLADSLLTVDLPEVGHDQPERTLAALTAIGQSRQPAAILLGNETASQEMAPRLAHRLGGSAVGDATTLEVVDQQIRAQRSVYGGKAVATIGLRRSPAVVWLRARAFAPPDPSEESRTSQPVSVEASLLQPVLDAPPTVRIRERIEEAATEARLEEARVIVAGGRGLGGPEPFAELQSLSTLLGGQTAASRAACDSGWCPPTWQVGQTGRKVAPSLYLAVAIRGASQHMAGISEARVIAAINLDPEAPIFRHCRFGIVEDYRKVLPLLQRRLAEKMA